MNSSAFENHSPRILIVDDDKTMRMLLRRIMEKEGYQVTEAHDGEEALEAYSDSPPDIVLLDARMPLMDGFVCCSHLQARYGEQTAPILMITSLEDEASVDRAFEVGARDYITKPIHWGVLRLRVRRLLQEKQTEKEILKALVRERELSELRARIVTVISHEYRTPLTTILLSAELLEHYGHKWSEDKKVKHLHRIQDATKHLTELVSEVMSISKVESGQIQLKPVPLNLETVCREIIREWQLIIDANHPLSVSVRPEVENVVLDAQLLKQVLNILFSNAIKYSPNGGKIHLEVMSLKDAEETEQLNGQQLQLNSAGVIFRVEDEGIGILPEDMEQVFDAFHRGKNVGTISGIGLGLAIAKRYVDLQKGQILIHTQVNRGTTVTVILPLIQSHHAHQSMGN